MKHRTFYFFAVSALFFGFGSAELSAANIEFICDVQNGFTFAADSQATVGYITSLTIGTTILRADLNGKEPITGGAVTAVAILSKFSWNGGASDPLSFVGEISTTNKQTLAALLAKPLTNAQVQIGFKVFQYDPVARKYFVALAPSTSAGLKGTVVQSGTPPKTAVAAAADETVKSPQNFQLSLQMTPQSIAQSIQYAPGAGKTVMMKWGVATP
jgi:hypothetical protein